MTRHTCGPAHFCDCDGGAGPDDSPPRRRRERRYTRAEVLAFGERVREACEKAVVGIGPAPLRGTYDNGVDDSADSVRAVDVARLLEEE